METNRLASAVTSAGIQLAVLGLGTVWRFQWGFRMRLLHDFLLGTPEQQLVVFSDSQDVIPVPALNEHVLLSRYNELLELYDGPQIFFAAETSCYPCVHLEAEYAARSRNLSSFKSSTEAPFKYLNGGLVIGPAGLLRRLIALTYDGDCTDDQLIFTLAYLDPFVWWADPASGEWHVRSTRQTPAAEIPREARPLIALDRTNLLFLAMFNTSAHEYHLTGGGRGVEYEGTHGCPLILHQNGDKRSACTLELLAQEFGMGHRKDKLDSCQAALGFSLDDLPQDLPEEAALEGEAESSG